MKSFRFVLLAVPMLLICCAKPAISQTHDHQAAETATSPDVAKAPPTEAQKSFTELKTLAGVWRGRVTLEPPMKGMGDTDLEVTMRVASRGNSIVHELQEADTPFDAAKYDHPITM